MCRDRDNLLLLALGEEKQEIHHQDRSQQEKQVHLAKAHSKLLCTGNPVPLK